MGQKVTKPNTENKLITSNDEFRQQLQKRIMIVLAQIPKDLVDMITDYSSLQFEFQIPNREDMIEIPDSTRRVCISPSFFSLSDKRPRNGVEYFKRHVKVTKQRIEVLEYTTPWMTIPILPSLFPGCDFTIKCDSFDMNILIVRNIDTTKRQQLRSFISFVSPSNDITHWTLSCVGCVQVSVENGTYVDNILVTSKHHHPPVPAEYRVPITKGTVDQYTIMIGCGWAGQCIEIIS